MTFEQYDKENPHIYEAFKKFAEMMLEKGHKRYGAKSIFEFIRRHTKLYTNDGRFKVDNNYTPDYARKLMGEDKRFEGFFIIKGRKEPKTPLICAKIKATALLDRYIKNNKVKDFEALRDELALIIG